MSMIGIDSSVNILSLPKSTTIGTQVVSVKKEGHENELILKTFSEMTKK